MRSYPWGVYSPSSGVRQCDREKYPQELRLSAINGVTSLKAIAETGEVTVIPVAPLTRLPAVPANPRRTSHDKRGS